MEIHSLKQVEKGLLTAFLKTYPFKKYQYIRPMKQDALIHYYQHRFQKQAENPEGGIWVAEERGKILGVLSLHSLPWDTEVLGVPSARISDFLLSAEYAEGTSAGEALLREAIRWLRERGVQFVDCRLDARDLCAAHSLEAGGFRWMESTLLYAYSSKMDTLFEAPETCEVRLPTEEDLPFIRRVAGMAFTKDRFHRDPHIPTERANLFHQEWAVNAALGKRGGMALVSFEGRPIGFHTFYIDEEFNAFSDEKVGVLELIALIPHPRAKYLWENLIHRLIVEGMARGLSIVESRTQVHNFSALFRVLRIPPPYTKGEVTFHAWFGER